MNPKVNGQTLVIRHDDFDFRMALDHYILTHQMFLDRGLVETVNLQFSQFGRLVEIRPEVVKYLLKTPNYDIQLHCWEHIMYANMPSMVIYRDLAASCWKFMELFHKKPTIWYPPWNVKSIEMEQIADGFGMTVDAESYDLKKFLREIEANDFRGHSVYFHAYQQDEMIVLPKVLDRIKQLNETR